MEMYCRKVHPISILYIVFGFGVDYSSCFAPPNAVKSSTRNSNWTKSSSRSKFLARTCGAMNGKDDFPINEGLGLSKRSKANDEDGDMVIIMDWECIVDCLPYYTQLGMDAARTVWPHLNDLCDDNDLGWVENKLAAISHILSPPSPSMANQHHPACEYALATRLILEEQALDQNQSTGKSGKYAKRFHPREELPLSRVAEKGRVDDDDDHDDVSSSTNNEYRPSVSTRPLTVGELAANWRDSIRETLQVRYRRESNDPIQDLDAVIHESIRELLHRAQTSPQSTPIVQLFPQTRFALSNTVRKVLIQTRHDTDCEILLQSLKNAGNNNFVRFQIASCVDDALSRSASDGVVVLRPRGSPLPSDKGDVLRQVLHSEARFFEGTTVTYIDTSWHRIQESIPLFGDSIPRHGTNKAKCVVPGRFLSLYLAEWPGMVHPQESKNAAILNPWTDSLSWEQTECMLVPPWSGATFL
jgi:hypothetical protein